MKVNDKRTEKLKDTSQIVLHAPHTSLTSRLESECSPRVSYSHPLEGTVAQLVIKSASINPAIK
jgi:hypothetical protein